jgi:hypothetical protein
MASKMPCLSPMPAIVLAFLLSACTVVPDQPGGRYAYVVRSAYPPPLGQFQIAQASPLPMAAPQPAVAAQPPSPATVSDSGINRLGAVIVALKCSTIANPFRDNPDEYRNVYSACIHKEADKFVASQKIGHELYNRAIEAEYGVKVH